MPYLLGWRTGWKADNEADTRFVVVGPDHDLRAEMQGFIDRAEVVPMRLITGAGYVRGAGGTFVPLSLDSYVLGYLDLDDLLASDDFGFQARLIHVLTERFATGNYGGSDCDDGSGKRWDEER